MPTLPALLAGSLHSGRDDPASCQAVLAWGRKPSALVAQRQAQRLGLPLLRLEDGFLRSWGTGDRFAPLALVTDSLGIYYDCTQPSDLESLLNAQGEIAVHPDVAALKAQVLRHGLSKYNHAPDGAVSGAASAGQGVRVLVIDQTWGDVSVALGAASADTFRAMLAAARAENPGATIYVKTHPEVSSGRKRGYLTDVQDDAHTVVLRQAINPLSLIEQMDKVYVVTSTMGFEALLAGKPVTCFGMPWYAGWGVTDDRQTCARRTRQRTVDELFAAAYIHYTRYLNPVTHQRGTILDVIDWLIRQRQMAAEQRGPGAQARRIVVVGLRRWKQANLSPMLALDRSQIHCVPDAAQAQALGLQPGDWLLFWGATPPAGLCELAAQTQAVLVRMEDGFVRSVGLGSDLIRPQSLVLDQRGIYFDPSQPSDLEHLLAHTVFSADELAMAQRVRAMIVQHGITKYNVEPREPARWPSAGRRVLLVPGQVEDDASIRLGCTEVKTNLDLLRAARQAQPQAYIVYKPHPDVSSGNRVGRLALAQALQWADHVETRLSVVSCIDACDEVHTMTSLTGFDALLRGKTVVTYGQPFYAGWGLTEDRALGGVALARRTRRLTLDELVAGALLRYPIYWDWTLKGYTTCEAVLHRIIETRTALEQSGGLEQLRVGRVRRLGRKLNVLFRAWLGRES